MHHFLSMMYPSTLMIADLFYWYLHCISFGWVWYFNYSCINFASNYCYLYLDKGRHWFYYRCQCVCFLNSHFDIFCDIIPWHVFHKTLMMDMLICIWIWKFMYIRYAVVFPIQTRKNMLHCNNGICLPIVSISSIIYMVHYSVHLIDELNQHTYKYQIKSNWEK